MAVFHDFFFYPYWWYPAYGYGLYEELPGLSYEEWGTEWANDLEHGAVTMEQFVVFLRKQVLELPDPLRDDFRRGFLKGYGRKGADLFSQALDQARKSAGRKPDDKKSP